MFHLLFLSHFCFSLLNNSNFYAVHLEYVNVKVAPQQMAPQYVAFDTHQIMLECVGNSIGKKYIGYFEVNIAP